jgi:hypothetical protein
MKIALLLSVMGPRLFRQITPPPRCPATPSIGDLATICHEIRMDIAFQGNRWWRLKRDSGRSACHSSALALPVAQSIFDQ